MQVRPIHLLALLLTLQALFLAFFVTPLGDIPDESGHYAYVIDMTKGRPLPVLGKPEGGKGEIPADLWKSYEDLPERHRVNYIVQHPPLYYAVAALPYALAKKFTQDKSVLARAARTVSALSLGLLILVIFKTLVAARVDERLALAMASWFGFVPMVSHLSSGISNDIFLTLTCAFATLYLVRFLMAQTMRDAYLCALWLTLAGATKMTSWLLIAGFLGILIFEMRQPRWRWCLHAVGLSALAFAAPVWWMRRNIYHFNDPLFVFGSHLSPKAPHYTLYEYFSQQPFFDWLFTHFYALVGFSGYCLSAPSLEVISRFCKGAQLTTVEGASMRVFTGVGVLCVLFLAHAIVRALRRDTLEPDQGGGVSIQSTVARLLDHRALRQPVAWLLPALALMACGLALAFSQKLSWTASGARQLIEFGIVFCAMVGAGVIALDRSVTDRIMAYGGVLLALFSLMVFLKGHEAFQLTGHPNGIQGRYLYPFIPLALASVGVAIGRLRFASALAATGAITVLLCWAHLNAYLGTLLPFFEWVAL